MKAKKVCLIGGLVMALFAIALLTNFSSWRKYKKGDVKNYNMSSSAELKEGDLVKGTVVSTIGLIAEREETKKHFGITTSKSTTMKYYCIRTSDGKYIMYATSKNDEYSLLERYADKYTAFLKKYHNNPDSVVDDDLPVLELPFEAEVKKMSTELNNAFENVYGEGYSSECNTEVYLSRANFDGYQTTVFIGFGLAGGSVILLLLFIVFTVKGKKAAKYGY